VAQELLGAGHGIVFMSGNMLPLLLDPLPSSLLTSLLSVDVVAGPGANSQHRVSPVTARPQHCSAAHEISTATTLASANCDGMARVSALPQHVTPPPNMMPHVAPAPAASAVKVAPSGGTACPQSLAPQHIALPSASSAQACPPPAATRTAFTINGIAAGTPLIAPPQQTTRPAAVTPQA